MIPPCNNTSVKFNEHFLKHNSDRSEEGDYFKYLNDPTKVSVYLAATNINEAEIVLNSLKSNPPGYDDIPPKY